MKKLYYHGGDLKIDVFTYNIEKKNRTNNVAGFYFTDRKEKAMSYGKILTTAYLNIKNPFILGKSKANTEMAIQFKKELIKENPHIDKYDDWFDDKIQKLFQYNQLPFTGMDGFGEQRVYIAGGFDSIIDGDEVAVFNPKNIKIISSQPIIENSIKGGKADNLTVKDIANKFNVSISKINKQIQKGIKVEFEHTSDKEKATEIATDHVSEFPDYYDRLEKMENKAFKEWKTSDITENTKNLIKRLIRENLGNNKKKRMLYENKISGKTIINVDIQPEYQKWITFDLNNWANFINNNAAQNKIVFLYNGADTLGMIEEYDYKNWLIELGVEEDVIENSVFYDKGYAFFRYCMDNSIDENDVAELVRFMISNNINDSREIDEKMWDNFMKETSNSLEEIKKLLENADDMISIPDLIDFLDSFSNIVLTGGGINECLKEVEISLLAMNKPYNIMSDFTY